MRFVWEWTLTQNCVGLGSKSVSAGPGRWGSLRRHQGWPEDATWKICTHSFPSWSLFFSEHTNLAGECIGELVLFFSLRMSCGFPPLPSHSTFMSSTFRFWWDDEQSSLKLKAEKEPEVWDTDSSSSNCGSNSHRGFLASLARRTLPPRPCCTPSPGRSCSGYQNADLGHKAGSSVNPFWGYWSVLTAGFQTCERVLRLPDPLYHHPGVVLSDAGRALVVRAPMLQYVMIYLAVGLWEGPSHGDGVVAHLAIWDLDLRSGRNCERRGIFFN